MLAAISSSFLLDILERAKWVFVAAYVFSTIGVTIGVYWEGEQFDKAKQHRGWRLLICSLAADTFFTIMVFGIEGWIGHIQRNEIIALETMLAPRSLSQAQVAKIAEKVRPFAGQEYTITTYWDIREPLAIAERIHEALTNGGWKFIPPGSGGAFLLGGVVGVQVWVHPTADPQVRNAADALIAALRIEGMEVLPKEQNPKNPKDNKIAVNVGTKF